MTVQTRCIFNVPETQLNQYELFFFFHNLSVHRCDDEDQQHLSDSKKTSVNRIPGDTRSELVMGGTKQMR
jgi:hypothetical protein